MKTVTVYTYEDYLMQEEYIDKCLSYSELAERIEQIARSWIADYNYDGDASDYSKHGQHMVMRKVRDILRELGKAEESKE